jgi:formate dehydrogenase subunit gamma
MRSRAAGSERVAQIIETHRLGEGPLLAILYALQREFGHIDGKAVPLVAAALNLPRAEVQAVIGFYHEFRDAPAGAHVLKLCRAEPCRSAGGDALAAAAKAALRIEWGETTADGCITLEPAACLGLCSRGPSAMLDGEIYGGLDAALLASLIDRSR